MATHKTNYCTIIVADRAKSAGVEPGVYRANLTGEQIHKLMEELGVEDRYYGVWWDEPSLNESLEGLVHRFNDYVGV